MNKYTIILPVHNGGNYIKECVNSILKQTLQNFNMIVLENNSTDGTLEWLNSLNNNRIVIYPSPNCTLTIEENWGRALTIPTNEFITLIGHDDVLLPDYLETMDKLISKHPNASLYQTHYKYINSEGEFVRHCLPMHEIQYSHEFLACHFLQSMDSMGTGYMFRKSDYVKVLGMPKNYPNLIFADYELWIRLTDISYKATSLNNCFLYRLHNSLSKTTNGMLYQTAFFEYLNFLLDIKEINVSIAKAIERYGHLFLNYYCEALSHRLLKTPTRLRTITIDDFVSDCQIFAKKLIPKQSFNPSSVFRIRVAMILDRNLIGRLIFKIYKIWF